MVVCLFFTHLKLWKSWDLEYIYMWNSICSQVSHYMYHNKCGVECRNERWLYGSGIVKYNGQYGWNVFFITWRIEIYCMNFLRYSCLSLETLSMNYPGGLKERKKKQKLFAITQIYPIQIGALLDFISYTTVAAHLLLRRMYTIWNRSWVRWKNMAFVIYTDQPIGHCPSSSAEW